MKKTILAAAFTLLFSVSVSAGVMGTGADEPPPVEDPSPVTSSSEETEGVMGTGALADILLNAALGLPALF